MVVSYIERQRRREECAGTRYVEGTGRGCTDVAHLEIGGEVLCRDFEEYSELSHIPDEGFCGHCRRLAEKFNLVEVP